MVNNLVASKALTLGDDLTSIMLLLFPMVVLNRGLTHGLQVIQYEHPDLN
jgi:hypothetical protein